MDWAALTMILADRGHEPLLALDASGTVRVATSATQKLLERARGELVGRHLRDIVKAASGTALESFLGCTRVAPTPRLARATALDGVGHELSVLLDIEPLANGRTGFLCSILSVQPARTFTGQDLDYEVAIRDGKPGAVRRIAYLGGAAAASELTDRVCFELICGLPAACPQCPAQVVAAEEVGSEHTSIRHDAGTYRISTAVRTDLHLVHVRRRHLRTDHLRDAQSARIDQLSRDATLSQREREVLEQLLLGAATDEIAMVLGISPRTVKFHQTNLLNKLGADSRVDLLRVLA